MAAFQNQSAATDLYMILAGEITRRDPNYFSPLEISTALKSELTQAERRVEQTMVDGYFGEDGFLHTTSNGEKMPSAATEDAEIDLEYAKQDVETFNLLMDNYQAINNYTTPPAIRKADFVPTIDKFINDHITQIGQLIEKSKILTKDSPEYTENKAKRRKLAGERSSARRLIARYFNVPETESTSSPTSESNTDDDMNMEKISTGKTKEQIEAEKTKKRQSKENKHQQQTHENTQAREHQQERPPASYHFEGGLVDKEITITVGQEIPDDWFESKKYGNRTNNGYGIKITRPPQIEDYLLQALNIEFGKLSEDERRSYNYRALAETIISEAKRTKKIPDIANIINHQQGINAQHKKFKRSHRQGASRQIEEELEDEMSM